jgi:hypothetical protein
MTVTYKDAEAPAQTLPMLLCLQGLRSALMLLDDAGVEAAIRHMGLVLYEALRPDLGGSTAAPAAAGNWPLPAEQLALQLVEGSVLGDPAAVAAAHQCPAPGEYRLSSALVSIHTEPVQHISTCCPLQTALGDVIHVGRPISVGAVPWWLQERGSRAWRS